MCHRYRASLTVDVRVAVSEVAPDHEIATDVWVPVRPVPNAHYDFVVGRELKANRHGACCCKPRTPSHLCMPTPSQVVCQSMLLRRRMEK